MPACVISEALAAERRRLSELAQVKKEALPKLDISQQKVGYYASLATYYSIYDLRRLKPEQTHLYLLGLYQRSCHQPQGK